MANSAHEAEEMIASCKKAGRTLMIAYRCQYDPFHRHAIEVVRSGELGPLRMIEAQNGQDQNPNDLDQWRYKKALAGGGSLPDVGIYGLNAARYLTGEEPAEVFGQVSTDPSDPRFREVEDRVAFQLRFPSGVLATCSSGYSVHETRRMRLNFAAGTLDMDPAFAYRGLRLRVSRGRGTFEADEERRLDAADQFALEMEHMARRVGRRPGPAHPGRGGAPGHADHRGHLRLGPRGPPRQAAGRRGPGRHPRAGPGLIADPRRGGCCGHAATVVECDDLSSPPHRRVPPGAFPT